jgi:hypothetical protein
MMSTQFGLIMSALFVSMILAFITLMVATVQRIDYMEDLLSKSKFVSGSKALYARAGLPGRVLRVCIVSTLLMMPRLFALKGLADLEQVRQFPRGLKVFLVSMWGVVLLSVLCVVCLDLLCR